MQARTKTAAFAACVAATVLFLGSLASAASLEQRLSASDGVAGDNIGTAVAIDGDTAVVGAPGSTGSKGAVYVFTRSGDTWNFAAKLTASDGVAGDQLGASVDISGNIIVAGAPFHTLEGQANRGLVYAFDRTGSALRNETTRLIALGSSTGDEVGTSVAIDGDEVVAGAPGDGSGRGSLFTFLSADTPSNLENEKNNLAASDGAASDALGTSVAIDGDEIVAGAPAANGPTADQGAVYTFARDTAGHLETGKLLASDGTGGDQLGHSVAIQGDEIVAGASGDSINSNSSQGSAYTFARTGPAVRPETAKLTASDGAAFDKFGASVAIDDRMIVVGTLFDDIGSNPHQGSLYTFARTGATRIETGKLDASDGDDSDSFGASSAVDGDAILVGAPSDDIATNGNQGSATVFYDPAPPPPTDTTPPTLDLSAKTSEKIGKTIKVKATCDEACSIALNGSVKPKGDDKTQLKPQTAQLDAGVATTIKIKLGKLKHALKDAGRGKAKLSAVATDAAGNASTADKAKVKLD
jgi:FG-GAP repeat